MPAYIGRIRPHTPPPKKPLRPKDQPHPAILVPAMALLCLGGFALVFLAAWYGAAALGDIRFTEDDRSRFHYVVPFPKGETK